MNGIPDGRLNAQGTGQDELEVGSGLPELGSIPSIVTYLMKD
jgi:hypothetical protein